MAVKSFGTAATQTMLDDQHALMHAAPLDSTGAPTSLPTGGVPTYASSDATVTLVPAADGLSCDVRGVKGTIGTPTVTVSFTNADGTIATGTAAFTITKDPAELDVGSFAVTVDPPTAQ
jgi:hypothetical protein